MSDKDVTSQSLSSRNVLTDLFFWRSTMLGAAALGFLATFMLLGHEVASPGSMILPVVFFLPMYLILVSLNMLWVARTMATMRPTALPAQSRDVAAVRRRRIVQTVLSLAFGVGTAIWYVHTVAK